MEWFLNVCLGNKVFKYVIFEIVIVNNFFINSIDFCFVMVLFGNILVNYNKKM